MPQDYISHTQKTNLSQGILTEKIYVLEELCKQPVERMVKTDPTIQDIKFNDLVGCIPKNDLMEGDI